MTETPWFEEFFGSDYLDMYEGVLTPDVTKAQVEGIINLLNLPEEAMILDLACGHGRHAIPLAQRGYRLTGFDLSPVFLDKARETADQAGVQVEWVRGDMRDLPFTGKFDAVINIFTAFGYFDDEEDDLEVLRGVRRSLKEGGHFLFETLHRDGGLTGRFQSRGFDETPNGSLVLRSRSWDLVRDVIDEEVTLIKPDGERMEYRTAVRLRSLKGYLELLREAELEPVAWYGGLSAAPLDLSSTRLAILAQN